MSYLEKEGTYVSTEGRVQITRKATGAPGEAREDWEYFRILSEMAGVSLPYNNLEELRFRIGELAPHLLKYDYIEPSVLGEIALKP